MANGETLGVFYPTRCMFQKDTEILNPSVVKNVCPNCQSNTSMVHPVTPVVATTTVTTQNPQFCLSFNCHCLIFDIFTVMI